MRRLAAVVIVLALSVTAACAKKKEPQVDPLLQQGQQELDDALKQLDKEVEGMIKDGETIQKGE